MSLSDALASERRQRRQAEGRLPARIPARRGQGEGAQGHGGDRHRRQPPRAGPRRPAAARGAARSCSVSSDRTTAHHRRLRPRRGRQGNHRRRARRARPAPVAEPVAGRPAPSGRASPTTPTSSPTPATFEQRIAAGGFLEWTEFLGNYYGTPIPNLVDGQPTSCSRSRSTAPSRSRAVPRRAADLRAPAHRARSRSAGCAGAATPATRSLARLRKAEDEEPIGRALADHVVVNDDLDDTIDEMLAIIEQPAQRSRDR